MDLDANIWGPHYWFFLDSIAMNYPQYPNDFIKKKYYDLIQNFPEFIPNNKIAKYFTEILNKYPIKPYLDNKKSLIRWVHFIHNNINDLLEKPKIKLDEFYVKYYNHYKNTKLKTQIYKKIKKNIIFISIVTFLIILVYYLYNKKNGNI